MAKDVPPFGEGSADANHPLPSHLERTVLAGSQDKEVLLLGATEKTARWFSRLKQWSKVVVNRKAS